MTVRAYQSVLDNFPDSVSYWPMGLVPPTEYYRHMHLALEDTHRWMGGDIR